MNQGIQSVDLLQWYMGPVQSVQSVAANVRHKEIEVEDTIVSTLKFANGALGTIECTTAAFPGSARRIEIHGTRGTAIIEDNDLVKWQFNVEKNGDKEMKNLVGESVTRGGASNPADINFIGHQKQIEDMINSIGVDRAPLIDGYEGRKSVEIVIAIYKSAKSGAMVTLSEAT